MKFLHLTEDPEGISHFADVEFTFASEHFAPPAPEMPISTSEPCTQMLFIILPVGWGGAKHRSPRRQVAFCLSGRLRVVAGDGEAREIGVGGIWRMEDTTGSGHTTSVLGKEDVHLAIVQLN